MKTYKLNYDVYVETSANTAIEASKQVKDMLKRCLSEQSSVYDYRIYTVAVNESGENK